MEQKNIHNLKQILMQQLMLHRIIGLISEEQYQDLIASVPSFLEACTDLKPMVKKADDELIAYRKVVTGVALAKSNERKSLAEYSFPIIESAKAWGIKNNNTDMIKNTAGLSISEMTKMGFQKLLDRLRVVQALVRPLVPLANYKIT